MRQVYGWIAATSLAFTASNAFTASASELERLEAWFLEHAPDQAALGESSTL